MKNLLSVLICFFTLKSSAQVLRQAAISPDASLVAFSYQGDIWTVPSSGGKAYRLTVHEAYESDPVFSPDGSKIAFTGNRFGNPDIFTIPTEGGLAQRLTYHSAPDRMSSWTLSDQILFSTSREFRQIERPSEIYAISPKGGTEHRILDALGYDPIYSPDGKFIAFVRGDINPVARKDYRGSSNREIWIYNTSDKTYHKLQGFETNDVLPQWGPSSTLYFLSSEDGEYNLYKTKIDNKGIGLDKAQKMTHFKDESIRSFKLSADGETAVLEKDMGLYLLKTDGRTAKKIEISINADERLDASELKTFSTGATEYTVSPNAKLMAYSIRGELFIKEVDKEKTRSINVSEHAYRDLEPTWLSDSTLLFTSDRLDGNFEIYMVRSTDSSQHNIFKSLKHEILRISRSASDESALSISPDGKKLAYVQGRGKLLVADIKEDGSLSSEKVLLDSWASPSGLTWSPDSKYLAYSLEDLYFNEEVFIHAADNSSKPTNVSMHPRTDRSPVWSADGSKLGFLSERTVGKSVDVWFAWLKKEDWEKASQDWQEKESPAAESPTTKPTDKKDKSVKAIKIDFDEIHKRIVQVTNFPGDEASLLISKDGETFYFTANSSTAKGRDLYSIKWDGKDLKELSKGGTNPNALSMDKDGKFIYYNKQGSLGRIDPKTALLEPLPFMAKFRIDYVAERTQVFEEAWRTIRDGFYDPNFHGYNWTKLKAKYKERCIRASTGEDFRDMFNLLLGELNASHMGLSVADRVETQRESTGLLGLELIPVKDGLKVKHVVPNSPADKSSSKINEGDIIQYINGEKLEANANFYQYLNGNADEKLLVLVQSPDLKTREVSIRPKNSLSDLLYDEWVMNRKKMVDQYSGGKIGYLHIKSMDFPSFETVEREFTAAGYGKEALVIDVRYNGGGSTTDYLMSILNYKQHAYTIPRGASSDLERDKLKYRPYYPTGERLVYSAWTKPSIALCNEGSYSNAEIFSHAYKALGIGKLVGIATNGSVISTGGKGLMDGSFVRLPFRGWFNKDTNKNHELGPAVPDLIVENEPNWIATGTDAQLKVAVESLMKEIEKR
jgi:tricorn protease